jgi:hypothetical protein
MQVQDDARPQFKWSLMFLDEGTNYVEREVELADAIFGLASSNLVGIFEKRRRFGNTMPILRHARSPVLRLKLGVQISHHFARYSFILDVRVAIGKAAPLFRELSGAHLDFTRPLNEFLQIVCH